MFAASAITTTTIASSGGPAYGPYATNQEPHRSSSPHNELASKHLREAIISLRKREGQVFLSYQDALLEKIRFAEVIANQAGFIREKASSSTMVPITVLLLRPAIQRKGMPNNAGELINVPGL